jgi:hypothetical protein
VAATPTTASIESQATDTTTIAQLHSQYYRPASSADDRECRAQCTAEYGPRTVYNWVAVTPTKTIDVATVEILVYSDKRVTVTRGEGTQVPTSKAQLITSLKVPDRGASGGIGVVTV